MNRLAMQYRIRNTLLRCSIQNSKNLFLIRSMLFSTTQERNIDVKSMSSKKSFDSLPVNPSILLHIQAIGVGIKSKKKKASTSRISSKSDILSLKEEVDYFLHKNLNANRTIRSKKTTDEGTSSFHRNRFTPPPPFSISTPNEQTVNTASSPRIKRLPVKVLGKAGSISDEMPRASKGLPEVAIIGRSNVGKSTLLNALLYGNQVSDKIENKKFIRGKTPDNVKISKGVKARVSNTPGETKEITFYQLSSQVESGKSSLLLVDLPGYGFSYSSESKATEWKNLMKEYLLNRGKSLKRILFLVDSRHGMKTSDFDFLNMLQNGLKEKQNANSTLSETSVTQSTRKRYELPPIQIVLTKADLVSQTDLAKRVIQVKQQMSEALIREPSSLPVMIVSAKAGIGYNNIRGDRACGGILELQREIASLVPIKTQSSLK